MNCPDFLRADTSIKSKVNLKLFGWTGWKWGHSFLELETWYGVLVCSDLELGMVFSET